MVVASAVLVGLRSEELVSVASWDDVTFLVDWVREGAKQ